MNQIESCVQTYRKEPLIRNSSLWTNNGEKDPMKKFAIDSTECLDLIEDRDSCYLCGKSRKFYCYNCYIPMNGIKQFLPSVGLPVKVDIIKHIQEVDGKSTSAHAVLIANNDVNIYSYPQIPDWHNQNVILVFPGPKSLNLNQLFCESNRNESFDGINGLPFDRVVFIDSTWRQTKKIYNDSRVKHLPSVILSSHDSLFWRHQRDSPLTYLATIEAIYYFFVDLYNITDHKTPYDGRYDNLLFFFKHTYNKLRKRYNI